MAPVSQDVLVAALRKAQSQIDQLRQNQDEFQALLRQVSNQPKWLEELPGSRSPYFATIDITIAASSTSRVEGTHTVNVDGLFVCVGVALFYKRTTAPYDGIWRPASSLEAKMAPASQGLGGAYIYDDPVLASFDIEIAQSGNDRNWQNNAFSSALFSPSVGGVYVLPVAVAFDRATVITVKATPTFAQSVAGKLQALLLGYKIVQGSNYQP